MKFVAAQWDIGGFEVKQLGSLSLSEPERGRRATAGFAPSRAKTGGRNSCSFWTEEELLCILKGTELPVRTLCFASRI
ncbi:MAG TPA: hypothetical protein VMW72_14970 [Sedimentisphaerales bacterium]|nr:hypothetical protein [Sedimentisphaerales bacterium]